MAEGLSRFNNPELNRQQEPPPDSAEALRAQIQQHEYASQHRGILDRATTDLINRGDEKTLAALKELEQKVAQGKAQQGEIAEAVKADREAMKWQGEVSMYGTGFMKAATLFLPGKGKVPWIAAGTVHSLDQIKVAPDISTGEMVADGLLGFGKGAGLKVVMDKASATSWRTWEKGLVIGGTGGAMESSMHRETWLNKEGKFDFGQGLGRTTQATFLGAGSGAVTFHFGHKLFKGISAKTGGALERSPLASNMGVGFSFGATGGFTGEALNQISKGEFDPVQLAVRSLLQGGVDMFAGGAGYKAGKLYMPENASAGMHQNFSDKEGPSLFSQIRDAGKKFMTPSEVESPSQFAGRKDGKDAERERNRERAEDEYWGTSEGENGGKRPKVRIKENEPVEEVTEPARQETTAPKEGTFTPAEMAEAKVALQARLDNFVANTTEKLPSNPLILYRELPRLLQRANNGQPIPDAELAVIKKEYSSLPQMIVAAKETAQAAKAQPKDETVREQEIREQEIREPEVREQEQTAQEEVRTERRETEEITSKPVENATEQAGLYEALMRRAAGEGDMLNPTEKLLLKSFHEARTSDGRETLPLEEKVAALKQTLEAEFQAQQERAAEQEGIDNVGVKPAADADLLRIPVIDIARDTNGMFTSDTVGGFKVFEAASNAYAAVRSPGEVGTQAMAELKQSAQQNPWLKPAMEALAEKHPEIQPAIKEAFENVVAPEAQPKQVTLQDIVTNRPEEIGQLVQNALNLAARAAKGEAGAQQALNELAKNSTDNTIPSKPVFDVQQGLTDYVKSNPEMAKSVYEAFKETLTVPEQAQFGAQFAREAVSGNAEAISTFEAFVAKHNGEGVKKAMIEAGLKDLSISDLVYDHYKDAFTLQNKFDFGAKYLLEAAARNQPDMPRLMQFAKDHPEPEVLSRMRLFADEMPALKEPFLNAFGQLDGVASDLPAIEQAGKFITNQVAAQKGEPLTERPDMMQFIKQLSESLQARVDMDQPYTEAQAHVRDMLDKMARRSGLDDTKFITKAVEEAPWKSDFAALETGNKLIEDLIAYRDKMATGEVVPTPDGRQFQDTLENAMKVRLEALQSQLGRQPSEAEYFASKAQSAVAIKKNLDRLAQSQGLENADSLNGLILEVARPVNSHNEINLSNIADKMIDVQIAHKKGEEAQLTDGADFVKGLMRETMTYLENGYDAPKLWARTRDRVDLLAALKGEANGNDMLPFIAEVSTIGHKSPSRPGTDHIEAVATPETAASVSARAQQFHNIMEKVKETENFDGSLVQKVDQWYKNQMQVRAELFEWLNKNPDLWYYAKEFGANTQSSSAAALIDAFPRMQTQFLNTDFPRFNDNLLRPKPSAEELARLQQEAKAEAERQQLEAQQQETGLVSAMDRPNAESTRAVEEMYSGVGERQVAGAKDSHYLSNPRRMGLEAFSLWRKIVEANVDLMPTELKTLFKRPELEHIPDQVLMDFISTNQTEAPGKKGGWQPSADFRAERYKQLQQALDAFKTPELSDAAKVAADPNLQAQLENATALGIKLAQLTANDRPLLADIMYKLGEGSQYKTAYRQMISAMLENSNGIGEVKSVMQIFDQIQGVHQSYLPRQPKGAPRIELTAEQLGEMMAQKEALADQARDIALETNPTNPDALSVLVTDLALGRAQKDERPGFGGRRPGGPGGPGGGPRPPRQ